MGTGAKSNKQLTKSGKAQGSEALGKEEDPADNTQCTNNQNSTKEGSGESLTYPKSDAKVKVFQNVDQLQDKVNDQEQEIIKLRQMLDVVTTAHAQNVRETKIIEFFKKNQVFSKALEKEQLLSAKLKGQIKLIKEQHLSTSEEGKIIDGKDFLQKKAEDQVHKESYWKEKYSQVNAKLLQIQGANSTLFAEVGRLQHALQREVGEHIPLSKVLDDDGEWKGRGQQICLLKDKIKGLKDKIKQQSIEDFQKSQVEARESIRKQRLEDLATKFLVMRQDLCNAKEKLGGVLARRNILESEIRSLKERMALLIRKNDNDDSLIGALRREIEACKESMDVDQLKQKVGCPVQFGSLHSEHQLAASFNDLKKHFYHQELQVKAQVELIEYLRAITGCETNDDAHEVANFEVNVSSHLSGNEPLERSYLIEKIVSI